MVIGSFLILISALFYIIYFSVNKQSKRSAMRSFNVLSFAESTETLLGLLVYMCRSYSQD